MEWQEIVVACIGLGVVVVLLRALRRLWRGEGRNGCAGCGADCPLRGKQGRGRPEQCERPELKERGK